MPKVEINELQWGGGSGYPEQFNAITEGRWRKRLGDAVGLDQFGVNYTRLEPGSGSALRHWHEKEDEFVFILKGEATLIEDDGETVLKSGDAAGFKAGVANGHHIVNRSDNDVILLEIGTRSPVERGHYPDDDLAVTKDETGYYFTRKNGEAYS